MPSSEDEIDFYSDPVKQLAKFNDVESSDDDDFEIKENILSSPKIPVTKITPKRTRRSKNSTKNDDLESIEIENIKQTQKVRPKTRSKKSNDDDFDILEMTPLEIRRRSTKKSPGQKRRMTRQQRTRLERFVTPKKSPKTRRGRIKRQQQNSSIIILSDDENPKLTAANTEQIVSDVNFEHRIKIWWQSSEINEFKIRKYQKLQPIYDFYSKRDGIPLNRLIFLLNNKTIYPTDTPDTLNLEPIHIIEGGCIDEDIEFRARESNNSSMIQLKVQLRDRKKPLHVFIKKTEPLSVLMAKCSEELECEIKKLRFEFDGDLLNPIDTPESLDFDGGECIDVFVK